MTTYIENNLENIRSKFLLMGQLATDSLQLAMESLLEGDTQKAKIVRKKDEEIEAMNEEISAKNEEIDAKNEEIATLNARVNMLETENDDLRQQHTGIDAHHDQGHQDKNEAKKCDNL